MEQLSIGTPHTHHPRNVTETQGTNSVPWGFGNGRGRGQSEDEPRSGSSSRRPLPSAQQKVVQREFANSVICSRYVNTTSGHYQCYVSLSIHVLYVVTFYPHALEYVPFLGAGFYNLYFLETTPSCLLRTRPPATTFRKSMCRSCVLKICSQHKTTDVAKMSMSRYMNSIFSGNTAISAANYISYAVRLS